MVDISVPYCIAQYLAQSDKDFSEGIDVHALILAISDEFLNGSSGDPIDFEPIKIIEMIPCMQRYSVNPKRNVTPRCSVVLPTNCGECEKEY